MLSTRQRTHKALSCRAVRKAACVRALLAAAGAAHASQSGINPLLDHAGLAIHKTKCARSSCGKHTRNAQKGEREVRTFNARTCACSGCPGMRDRLVE